MEFSFGLLTANRKFTKALRRIYDDLNSLDEYVQRAEIEDNNYDLILVSFTDNKESSWEEIVNKDRVFQVCVGLNHEDLSFLPKDDELLKIEMCKQIKRVFHRFPSEKTRKILIALFNKWEKGIGDS